MAASRAVANSVHNALSKEQKLLEILKEVEDDLPTQLAVAAEKYRDDIDKAITKVTKQAQSHKDVDPDDVEWVRRFYRVDSAEINSLIEEVFGIPTSVVDIESSVYGKLVAAFEEAVLNEEEKAPTHSGPRNIGELAEDMEEQRTTEAAHRRHADHDAEEAVQKRRQQIEGAPKRSKN